MTDKTIIDKIKAESVDFYSKIESALCETYFRNFDAEHLKSEELKNDLLDHTFRRYEQTLKYYIPWISKVVNLTNKEIIEIGCGTGSSTAAFAHFAKHIYAYEIANASVLAARLRMEIMEIENVSISQIDAGNLLSTLRDNHAAGVDVVLLFAVLEHMTVRERLDTLKLAWDLLSPDGILIVAETPNRLTYFDFHTSWLPFFHLLPLDLAVEYHQASPRELVKLTLGNHLGSGDLRSAEEALTRLGTTVSFHEFEIAFGHNLKSLIVADGDAEEMRSLYPCSTEERLLQEYFLEKNIQQPLAFANQMLNLIFQKNDSQMKSPHLSLAGEKSIEDNRVTFQQHVLKEMPQALQRVAVLVTPEYEGIFRNGGIGTYYKTLSERLAAEGFYVILLLCHTQEGVDRNLRFPAIKQIFLTQDCHSILSLQNTQTAMLSRLQAWEWVDYENYCALFFIQAIANTFPDAYIYVEFPEMLGLGYRTIQAKRSGSLGRNCVIAVTLHSCQEWLQEAQARHTQSAPEWFWQTSHYEQSSFEQADLAFFLSHFLKNKVERYGWKTNHALHLPYCFRVIERSPELLASRRELPQPEESRIPLVFFGRLEERKGLLTFLKALQLLNQDIIEKLHVFFLGKSAQLQTESLQGIESKAYIREFLGDEYDYSIVTDLFSQEAVQFINELSSPIVCLVSPQENFPNAALEMGQLPINLIVSNTGGFQETLGLIERTQGVYWFVSENVRSLAQAIMQAMKNYSGKPEIPTRESLDLLNQRLLNQRWQYMKQAFHLSDSSTNALSTNVSRPWILGMTSMLEQLYLEAYAQKQYSGQGEIVELGCWFGSSTISLAMGLERNGTILNKEQRIHAYDLFVWSPGMEQLVVDTSLKGKYKNGDSFLGEYLNRISPWEKFIEVHPGDLTELGCQQGKIECLFVDAMKSWKLADSIAKNFFPYLIPEVSLVIHQDFAHYYTAWIHLLMYRLRKYLIPIEHSFIHSSRVFQAIKPISDNILNEACSFDTFTETEVEASFAYSFDITPEKMKPNILAAKVMYFVHTKKFERAKSEFKAITANFDYAEFPELSNVKNAAKQFFSLDLSA